MVQSSSVSNLQQSTSATAGGSGTGTGTGTSSSGATIPDDAVNSAATAKGIDLYLAQGPGVDFVTYNAVLTTQLQQAKIYTPAQISNTLDFIQKAYNQAAADDAAGKGPSSFANSDPNKQYSYSKFVQTVGSEVLPGAGEPTFLSKSLTGDDENKISNWGVADANKLQAGADFQSALNQNVQYLESKGVDDHGNALYRQNFLATYYKKQQSQS